MKLCWKLGAIVAAAATLAGCSMLSSGQPVSEGDLTPVAKVLPPPKPDYGAILQSVALRPSDFKAGYSVKLAPQGNVLKGQPTLQECGYHYTSEAKRLARREYLVYQGSSFGGIGNEVVAYSSPTDAKQAVAEFRAAIGHCKSDSDGNTEQIVSAEADDPSLPVPNSEEVNIRGTDAGGHQQYGLEALQVRGQYLSALFVVGSSPFTVADVRAIGALAVTTGMRLSKLS